MRRLINTTVQEYEDPGARAPGQAQGHQGSWALTVVVEVGVFQTEKQGGVLSERGLRRKEIWQEMEPLEFKGG